MNGLGKVQRHNIGGSHEPQSKECAGQETRQNESESPHTLGVGKQRAQIGGRNREYNLYTGIKGTRNSRPHQGSEVEYPPPTHKTAVEGRLVYPKPGDQESTLSQKEGGGTPHTNERDSMKRRDNTQRES